MADMKAKSNDEWANELDEDQYRVLREKATEPPFSGKFVNHFEDGSYRCAACGNELFSSETKFESGCGWPSFYDVDKTDAIELHEDTSYGMIRTEVTCAQCGGHLGHVFNDGPKPTGLRYCINSAALSFGASE